LISSYGKLYVDPVWEIIIDACKLDSDLLMFIRWRLHDLG